MRTAGAHTHSSRGRGGGQRFTVCGSDGHFFVLFILKLIIILIYSKNDCEKLVIGVAYL